MRIAMIGLGKLGLPVAHAISVSGHQVRGYDPRPPDLKNYPHEEVGTKAHLSLSEELRTSGTKVQICETVGEAVAGADIVFVAVQTPHDPDLEGDTPNPGRTADFNYEPLEKCLDAVCPELEPDQVLAIISTVAPGTFATRLEKRLAGHGVTSYVYTPQFIAMGTVINDYFDPEFWLVGTARPEDAKVMEDFYATISEATVRTMNVPSAEIVKMSYNTWISAKLMLANNVLELCDVFGGDADDVSEALKSGKHRLTSRRYMTPGMGDGGGCHPRDLLVLSHLALKHKMSIDLNGFIMGAREEQTDWMAKKVKALADETGLPVVLVGRAFKPDTKLVDGSPAVLLGHLLKDLEVEHLSYDPMIDGPMQFLEPAIFFISTRHEATRSMRFPVRSVIVDPHRYMAPQAGVRLIALGKPPAPANASA